MTSSGWQNSQSNNHRHVHTPVKDELGHEICSVCRMVVITPILSSDDPRLHPPPEEIIWYPLPDVLIALYYAGPEYGWPKAPVAPYIRDVASFEGDITRFNPEELWDRLSEMTASPQGNQP
jgi:hypothetical protein